VRGQIDLIFKEEDGWVLVDYKTDRARGGSADNLAKKYAPQVQLYAKVWERSTRETVKEALLYFLSENLVVRVSQQPS
jgi:ATP-dependent helicase/nuclease subunit A